MTKQEYDLKKQELEQSPTLSHRQLVILKKDLWLDYVGVDRNNHNNPNNYKPSIIQLEITLK